MTISVLGTLLCYMIISSFTPGPGNILAMNTTTRFGWEKGKKLILGICCGYLLVQMICTAILYSLNMVLSPVLSVLKYVGAIYMVWLAIHIAISRQREDNRQMLLLLPDAWNSALRLPDRYKDRLSWPGQHNPPAPFLRSKHRSHR